MRRLRVFVPSSSEMLNDDGRYGEGLIAWNLFSELARRGHELVVCARRARLSSEPPFELIVTGPASRFESIEPLAYMRVARRLCEARAGAGGFDVAHWLFPSGDSLLFEPPAGVAFVAGPTGAPWPDGAARRTLRPGDVVRELAAPLFARGRRRTLSRLRVAMGATPEAARWFPPERVEPGRFRVVPFGVDADRFPVRPLPEEPRVLFVGRVVPEKGVHELVEAFARVRALVPAARLELAGAGEANDHVRARAAELGLADAVLVHGRVEQEELPELYARCSLLCLPSHADAFGMVLLEAMAAGRAVVASDVIGPRFLLAGGEGGRLVPPRDVDALAAALAGLLADRTELERLGAANRRRVEERFTIARCADAVEAAYAAALEAA